MHHVRGRSIHTMSARVFVNYRTADCPSHAAFVHHELSRRFGSDLIFMDNRSIPAGTDFERHLLDQVRQCRIMLAIIGPHWLGGPGPGAQRYLDDPTDWIRRELSYAFRLGATVIPVLIEGTRMPMPTELPKTISALARCQYRRLRYQDLTHDLDRICTDLAATDPVLGIRHQPQWRATVSKDSRAPSYFRP